MTQPPLTSSRLWKRMTSEQRLQAARAFWNDEEASDQHLQAVLAISERKKFRPKTVVSLDEEKKARHLASLATVPEVVAARALITYHLTEKREMMAAFLDALGIKHEDGLINEDQVVPDAAKIAPAAATLAEKYSAADVSLYLNTLLCQDPETWKGLAGLPYLEQLSA